jgi:hypothetical protein
VRHGIGGPRPQRWWGDVAGVALAMLVIGGPALFTRNGFMYDFTNHLWLVSVQEQAFSRHLVPTYYLNAPAVGAFYPFFVFYGGTLYAATGALAALIAGHVTVAYVGASLLAIAAAYGGLLWLARQLGVSSWMAHAPAITYVAGAYYVTNLYGRGAWPEFMATSMIPLLAASGWRLARAPRIEVVPAALFVIAAVFFAGSHNITLLFGSLSLIGGLIFLRVALGREVAAVNLGRLLWMAGLLALAVAVDAWFLLPDVVHERSTLIAVDPIVSWHYTSFFDTPAVLFDPLRTVPKQSSSPALFVQAPDWFLLWVIAAGAILWSRAGRALRRAGIALVALLAVFLVGIMVGPVWDHVPRTLQQIQFPYRLNTYLDLTASGLVLAAVIAVERVAPKRLAVRLRFALGAATAISLGLCLWQLWVPNTHAALSYQNRDAALASTHVTPRTWYDPGVYDDASQPIVTVPSGSLPIDTSRISGNEVTLTVTPPPGGAPFATNIAGAPYLVSLSGGLVRVGRTIHGLSVLRRRVPGRGPVQITLRPSGGALAIGRDVALLAIVVLLALLVAGIVTGRRSGVSTTGSGEEEQKRRARTAAGKAAARALP